MDNKKIRIKTNKPIGFIITDFSGNVLKKGGPCKTLIKENRKYKESINKKRRSK